MVSLGVQSVVSAGVATVLSAAAVLAPVDDPLPTPPTVSSHTTVDVTLSAAVVPLPAPAGGAKVAVAVLPSPSASASESVAAPQVSSVDLAAFPSLGNAIINVYNAVEPWVAWGFDVAQYAVGWVPVVGWLAPQIGIFYDFGESIVQSVVFNFANWISGNVTFLEGIGNIARDSWNATVQLGVDELNWILPPLPPWPPIFGGRVAADAVPGDQLVAESDAAQDTVAQPEASEQEPTDAPEATRVDDSGTTADTEDTDNAEDASAGTDDVDGAESSDDASMVDQDVSETDAVTDSDTEEADTDEAGADEAITDDAPAEADGADASASASGDSADASNDSNAPAAQDDSA